MKKRGDKLVLQPTEKQKLRLQLAKQACTLNLEERRYLDAEWRFYQSEIQRFEFPLLCQKNIATV